MKLKDRGLRRSQPSLSLGRSGIVSLQARQGGCESVHTPMTDSTVYRALVDSRRGRDDEGEVEVVISSIERFSVELGDQFLAQCRR